jgi:hypothetical protein
LHNIRQGKAFFFEKKNQKTFNYYGVTLRQRAHQTNKSFCFFFQKEVLPPASFLSRKNDTFPPTLSPNTTLPSKKGGGEGTGKERAYDRGSDYLGNAQPARGRGYPGRPVCRHWPG